MKKLYYFIGIISFLTVLSSCYVVVEEPWDPRDNFVGFYEAEEYSQVYESTTLYNMDVYKDSYNTNQIWFSNFYGVDIDIFANVNGSEFRIPTQRVGPYEVTGWGYHDDNGRVRLFFTFIEYDFWGELIDECDALLFRL